MRRFIDKADVQTKNEIERLVQENALKKKSHELTYDELDKNIENLWSVLLLPDILTHQVLSQDEIVSELLYEYPLLSPKKFDTAVLLESFNYGDALERMRVRMVH